MPRQAKLRLNLTVAEANAVVSSLQMKICFIETGTVIMRQSDAIQQNETKMVRSLDKSQRALVLSLEDLIESLGEQLSPHTTGDPTDDDSEPA